MTNFRLGYQGVLYYCATPLNGRPGDSPDPSNDFLDATWIEFDNVMDVDNQFQSEKVDTTTRAEAKLGWASEIQTIKSGVMTVTMRHKPGDTAFEAFRDAWLFGKEIALLDLDGPIDELGNSGLVGNFTLSYNFKKPVKGIMTVEVTASVSSYPNWVEVVTGPVLAAVTAS